MSNYTIHFDGAVRENKGHPSPIGYGFCVFREGREVFADCGSSPKLATSNIAEWTALMYCLKWCVENLGEREFVEINGDSQLIINQFTGEFKVKNSDFLPYYILCRGMYDVLAPRVIQVSWVPREHPRQRRADDLSKEGLQKFGT